MVSIQNVFKLINPGTCGGVLSLLYYAYASQTQTCEEFKKWELIKLRINIRIVAKAPIGNLKDVWLGLQSSPNKSN
jgi:hypothetical protein